MSPVAKHRPLSISFDIHRTEHFCNDLHGTGHFWKEVSTDKFSLNLFGMILHSADIYTTVVVDYMTAVLAMKVQSFDLIPYVHKYICKLSQRLVYKV